MVAINKIAELALEAGKVIMEVYNNEDFSKVVDFKADKSPLTLADKYSHNVIAEGLQKLDPNIPVISEEGKDISYEERKNWNTFWLVDPLDGTKEFIKRNGEFTVNIALIQNAQPILGVIFVPALQTLYYGQVGEGAYKVQRGKTEKIQTSGKVKELIGIGSRSHSAPEEEAMLEKYNVAGFVSAGSALKFCLVAEGKADIYYRHNPTMEWDTAAGQAIVEASGGVVFNAENKKFSYNKTSLVNGSFLCLGNPENFK